MAFGQHWEWRGFGRGHERICREILQFPALYPEAQEVTDRYLWAVGCELNVKLRFDNFKLKRLVSHSERGIEEWLEDPDENFEFPLAPDVVLQVAKGFGVDVEIPESGLGKIDDDAELLEFFQGKVRVIEVAKVRTQHRIPGTDVVIERAAISAPESVVSIGIEHPTREAVETAVDSLGLAKQLMTKNYLQALDVWGHDATIFS